MKCFKLNEFLEKPSIFHVNEVKVVVGASHDEDDRDKASATRVDLSEESSLTLAVKKVFLGDLQCRV